MQVSPNISNDFSPKLKNTKHALLALTINKSMSLVLPVLGQNESLQIWQVLLDGCIPEVLLAAEEPL